MDSRVEGQDLAENLLISGGLNLLAGVALSAAKFACTAKELRVRCEEPEDIELMTSGGMPLWTSTEEGERLSWGGEAWLLEHHLRAWSATETETLWLVWSRPVSRPERTLLC
jgi:hypothetical protein